MIRRVALIFDDLLRPDTTGVYVRRALAELVDVVHFRPNQRDEIPVSGFDLYQSVDDDTDPGLRDHLHPRDYWAIDTHGDFQSRLSRARGCDAVVMRMRAKYSRKQGGPWHWTAIRTGIGWKSRGPRPSKKWGGDLWR